MTTKYRKISEVPEVYEVSFLENDDSTPVVVGEIQKTLRGKWAATSVFKKRPLKLLHYKVKATEYDTMIEAGRSIVADWRYYTYVTSIDTDEVFIGDF